MPVAPVDAFTRHQIYLEGYKDHLEGGLVPLMRAAFTELSVELARLGVTDLGELTRRQLTALIRRVEEKQVKRHAKYRADTLRELRAFTEADTQLNRRVLEEATGEKLEDADKAGTAVLGAAILKRNRRGRALLWANVRNAIDPATGLNPVQVINQYLGYVARTIRETIRQGYANKWTIKDTLAAVFGTKSKRFKDGLARRFFSHGATTLRTVVQHISSHVQAAVASVFYKYYEWVSVLDQFTSNICRHRDGKVWAYGSGPLPPAHRRCRSSAVPIPQKQTKNALGSFYAWLKLQPASVQDDIVGKTLASGLRSGRVGALELGKFRTRGQLTLEQLLAKYVFIIT